MEIICHTQTHKSPPKVLEFDMNTFSRTARYILIFGLALSALAATAVAASPSNRLLIAPGEPYGLPKFGFSGSTIYGYGERVVSVRHGGRAERLGLEPGDVILSLNGYRLTYSGSWNDALSRALARGGLVRLQVRDVRTGDIRFRETFVNYGGPVEHYRTSGNGLPFITINGGGIHVSR